MVIDPLSVAQTGMTLGSAAFPPLAVAQLGLGAIQTGVSLAQLRKLRREQMANFDDNLGPLQENVNMWKQQVNQGLPQSYIDNARAENASQTASAYRRIQDASGGQLSSSFSRIGAMDRIRLGLQLAQMDATSRRQAMGMLSSANQAVTSQKNIQTNADRSYRIMQEQALGGALKAGTQNLAQAIDYSVLPAVMNQSIPGYVPPQGNFYTPPNTIPGSQAYPGASDPYPVSGTPFNMLTPQWQEPAYNQSYDLIGRYKPTSRLIITR